MVLQPQSKPQAEQEFNILDLFGTADKSLDQVKKYLEASKEELKKLKESGNLEDLAANIYRIAENGLREDLKENGVTDETKQAPYVAEFKKLWEEMDMDSKAEAIINSSEFAAMDQFVSRAENLPKLKELIDSAEPQAKWQTMIAGILASFPQLEQYLGSDITSFLAGLGVLPDKEKEKETGKIAEGEEEKKGEEETGETATETAEAVPESFKPGRTLILGDSNFNVFSDAAQKELRGKMNVTDMIAKGGQQSGWLLTPGGEGNLESRPDEFFGGFENVVIGFGSNDLGTKDTAGEIWGRLRRVIGILRKKNPKIKIIMATVPPGKGNNSGEWATDFEGVEKRREELNLFIKEAHTRNIIQGVIDLAAKKSQGGLADDADPSAMAQEYRRFADDPVHAKADVLVETIRKGQYQAYNVEITPETNA